jgi:hypothetical protein
MKINQGQVIGKSFVKTVCWNKAVLWMAKKVSVNLVDAFKITDNPITYVEFHDRSTGKNVIRRATKKAVLKSWNKEQHGQEPQYYIPIEIFKIITDSTK